MAHEVAVHLKKDLIPIEEEIPRVFHPFRDDFTLVIKGIGIVDVAFFGLKFGAVTHDVSLYECIIDDIIELLDMIRLGGVDMIGDGSFFPTRFHRVVHFGMEIAYVVEITHHLGGRVVGFVHIVIYRCLTESLVQPSPHLAIGTSLRLVVNPNGKIGLKGVLVRLEGDI